MRTGDAPVLGAATPLVLSTYDADANIGHPSVVHIPQGFGGHAWWMAATPYPDASRENPHVFYADDPLDWAAVAGNPVVPIAEAVAAGYAYDSDTHLVFTGTELWLYYRFATANTKNAIYRKTTTDGVVWSAGAACVTDNSNEVTLLSPAVVKEADGTYSMWVVDYSTAATPVVKKRTSSDGLSWSAGSSCTLPSGIRAWHIDVQRVGSTYHMLLNSIAEKAEELYYLTSTDGLTWTGDLTVPAVEMDAGDFGANRYYRSCMVPRQGAPLRWDLYLTAIDDSPSEAWRVTCLRDTPLPTVTQKAALEALRLDRLAGALGSEVRWKQGDTFARADNAAALGTSSSGDAWTTLSGTPTVNAKTAYSPSGSARAHMADSGLADCEVACDFTAIGEAHLLVRITDDSNWWAVGTDQTSGRVVIDKRVAGTVTRVFTESSSWHPLRAGDRLRVRMSGTSMSVYRNMTLITTITATEHSTATKHGVRLGPAGGRIKNIAVGSLS